MTVRSNLTYIHTHSPRIPTMAVQEISGIVNATEPMRVDLFVRTLIQLSRSKLTGLFEHGSVQLNGQPCSNPETRVSHGDRVVVAYDQHQGYAAPKRAWSDRAFIILHEDDDLIVVNKTAGVLTVPTNKEETNTLLDRISYYLSRKKRNHAAGLVHRLDRGISGVMVFAKTPAAAANLRSQFDKDEVHRMYVAIVHDVLTTDEGTMESWLDTHNNLNRFSTNDKSVGQHAVTKFKVLKRMPDATSLELELVTARRHQARVQLFEAGHRIVGEPRYGNDERPHERWHSKRMAMHATALSFVHPTTEQLLTFKTDLPIPMKKFLRFRPLVGDA